MNFQKFDRDFDSGFKFFKVVWCVMAVAVLGIFGVAAWAVIRLVTHFAP